MATAKEKRIRARLEQIKERAAEESMRAKKPDVMAELAEEAAGLGLELADLKEKK